MIKGFNKKDLHFIPLGGTGEIGMNCYLYHYNDSWLMIDLGVMFSNNDSSAYELIMPNLNFIFENKLNLSGIILTHAHEDHIGAVPYLNDTIGNIPIYTTSFTASVLKRKFDSIKNPPNRINLLEYNKIVNIGNFEIEILSLTHSIPEPNAIILKTPTVKVFHTGDWKIDPQPLVGNPINIDKISSLKKTGIDVMVCDSTNVFDENPSGSEDEVRKKLRDVFQNFNTGKIVITCFASNIARLETILKISNEFERSCVLLGRSMHRIYDAALESNYLTKEKNIISEKDAKYLPDENLVLICTGSQGESRASLYRLVNGKHKHFYLNKNDLIIFSSREIPGNEKAINDIKAKITKIGSKMLDHKTSNIHVSGHPSKTELKKMYDWVNPGTVIPIHGEYRHLFEHKKYIDKCKVSKSLLVENGDVVKLSNQDNTKIIDKVFSGRNVMRGKSILSIDNNLLSRLNLVSSNGELYVAVITNTNNVVVTDPLIFCPTITDEDLILDDLKKLIKNEFSSLSKQSIDDNILSEQIKVLTRSFIKNKIGLKPLTYIEIVRI